MITNLLSARCQGCGKDAEVIVYARGERISYGSQYFYSPFGKSVHIRVTIIGCVRCGLYHWKQADSARGEWVNDAN